MQIAAGNDCLELEQGRWRGTATELDTERKWSSNLMLASESTRGRRTGVVLKDSRFPALISHVLRLDRDIIFHADAKGSAVGELDVDLGTIGAVLEYGEETHDFGGKFFAFNHSFSNELGRTPPLPSAALLFDGFAAFRRQGKICHGTSILLEGYLA
jgi:hypothetical protein